MLVFLLITKTELFLFIRDYQYKQLNQNYLLIISNNSTSKINKLFAGIVGLGRDP